MSGCLACASHAHPVPAEARRDTGVRDSGKLPHGCWKSNPGPGEQPVCSQLLSLSLHLHLFPDRWQGGVVDVKSSVLLLTGFNKDTECCLEKSSRWADLPPRLSLNSLLELWLHP